MWSLFKDFLKFLRREKKWWLFPVICLLLLLAAILIFSGDFGISWALYPSH